MQAWHGSQTRKERTIERMRKAAESGQLARGTFLGTLTGSGESPHEDTEEFFGIPVRVAYWIEAVFEGIYRGKRSDWAIAALEAIPAGADRASIGAPHIRQRLFWVADTQVSGHRRRCRTNRKDWAETTDDCSNGGLEHTQSNGRDEGRAESDGRRTPSRCGSSRLANTEMREQRRPRECRAGDGRCELPDRGHGSDGWMGNADVRELSLPQEQPARQERSTVAGAGWADFDLIPCLDGKSRRVESGTFPLAHGLPRGVDEDLARLCALAGMAGDVRELRSNLKQAKRNRVGQLKGYGNAIVPQLAAEFVRAFMES